MTLTDFFLLSIIQHHFPLFHIGEDGVRRTVGPKQTSKGSEKSKQSPDIVLASPNSLTPKIIMLKNWQP